MEPLVKGKAKQAWPVVFWCMAAIVIFVTILVFSPPKSDPVPVSLAGPGRIMSTVDLQRALNRIYPKLKLKVDGVYGPATKAAHERACGDQYAKELMVREAK